MKLKKVIIIMLIFILIVSLVIVSVLIYNKKNNTISEETDRSQPLTEFDSTIQRVSIRNNFYMIKSCVDKFYNYYAGIYNSKDVIGENGTISKEEQEKECIKAIYNMLDEEYINYKNITSDNLKSKLSETKSLVATITDMYESQKDESMYSYFVYGNVRDKETSEISNFSMEVKADMRNRTYKVLLQDYVEEKYNDIQIGKNVKINLPDKIEENEYNKINFKATSDSNYVTDIINVYKNDMMFNVEEAYSNLDSEYREKRFKNLESFKEYASEKKDELKTITVKKFKKEKYDDYVQYVCIDNKGEYIIINEVAPMKYSLILDTYTVDLPEFRTKYKSVDNKNKVALNMEKIKDAINENDYGYVYSKLNETLKNNNFPNYNDFVEDFAPKFFKENTFKYKKVEEGNNIYYITILVKDKNDDSQEGRNMKFVMRLLNDTNFEISYNIE